MNPAPIQAYVVEDNPTICDNLVRTLEELASVRVIGSSATQAQAADWLARHAFDWDLLIVDLFLRGGSGMQLVQHLARRASWQKVVVFSNYVNAHVRKRCAQRGIDAVFDKSTEIDALVDYCARQAFLRGESARVASVMAAGDAPPSRPRQPKPAPAVPPA